MTGAQWHKSTQSDTQGCVEVAENLPGRVYVRDTKDRDGGTLAIEPASWRAFIAEVTGR